MNLTQLTSKDLANMARLLERKEALLAQVAKIEKALANYCGEPAPIPKPKKARKGTARGKLKEAILRELNAAGKAGITIKELAVKTGAKTARLYSWFYSTGKKMKTIKKIGEAKYALG
jgi:hypothetical protein